MKSKTKVLISFILIISIILPFVFQTAADEIVLFDEICGRTAESSVMTKCNPGYYITNCSLRLRNAPSIVTGRELSWIAANKVLSIVSVEMDSDGYYWGYTTHHTKSGIFSGYVRLDNCTKYSMPALPTADNTGKYKVNWTVIDVSSFQKEDAIDWYELKNSGVKGVILRIGGRGYGSQGILYNDDSFLCHYLNARAAGLHVGCYFFSYAMTAEAAVEEADYTVNLLKQYNAELDMPVFIDIEDADGDKQLKHQTIAGKTGCTEVCKAFCAEIKKAGYYPGVYCNLYFANNFVDVSAFTGNAVWIAQYNSSCDYTGTTVDMWQYTQFGNLSGYISTDLNGNTITDTNGNTVLGYIDIDCCYKNYPRLIAESKNSQETTTEAEETTTIKINTITLAETTTAEEKTTLNETTSAAEETTEEPTTVQETEPETTLAKRTVKKVITKTATCTINGTKDTYINNVYHGWAIVQKQHAEGRECILQNVSNIKVGKKLTEDDIASAMYPDSPYFETALSAIKKANGYTVSYCPDCLKIISINYYNSSTSCEHNNPVSTEITPATCVKDGVQQTKCPGCSEILSLSVIPKGHTKGEKKLTSDVERPYLTTYCAVCNKSIAKKILEKGDIDYNGTVSVKDARNILRISIGINESSELDVKLGDSDGDNILTITDARNALRKALKFE